MLDQLFGDLDIASVSGKIVLLAVVVIAAIVVQKVSVRFSSRVLKAAKVPQASILLNIQRTIIWCFALLMVLHPVFGIEPTGFVATLGVTSVALSLGLQDTVSNVIGGLSLMLSHVIAPGDMVTVAGFTGRVTDIDWRWTCVEDRAGSVSVIPNSVLSKSSFTKLSEAAASSASVKAIVAADADLELVEREVRATLEGDASGLLDETAPLAVKFSDRDAYGVTMTLTARAAAGVAPLDLADLLSRSLSGKSWLAQNPLAR